MEEDDREGPAPVPDKRSGGSWPREVFIHLLTFITLYIVAIGVLILSSGLIDNYVEDPLRFGPPDLDSARAAISMLVVAFPVFLYLSNYVRRKTRSGELKADSMLRKILIYLTLLVIAVTGMITLMVTINRFLGGDLTLAFALKSLSIFAVVGMVFWYYQTDLRTMKR